MFQLFTLPLALYAFWRQITQVFASMTVKVPEFTMLLNSSKAPVLPAENTKLFLHCHLMTYPLMQLYRNIIILRIYITEQGAKICNRLFQYPKYWCHQLINILLLKGETHHVICSYTEVLWCNMHKSQMILVQQVSNLIVPSTSFKISFSVCLQ